MRRFELYGPLLLAALIGGCNGFISDASSGPGGSTTSPTEPRGPVLDLECETDSITVGETPLRRLTAEEYRHSARDLLGQDQLPAEVVRTLALIPDGRVEYFASSVQAPDPENARAHLTLAETLASDARSRDFAGLVDCDLADVTCVRSFIESFGRRAFRRPLAEIDPALADDYLALHQEELASTDATTAFETLLSAFFVSPHFLYHAETADAPTDGSELAPLDGYSVASRLSFLLWSSGPDDALLDAAAAGELDAAEGVEAHARAMLEDPRAARGIRSFHAQWLRLSEVEGITRDDPQWREGMGASMKEEALRFADHVIREGDGTLRELLTASYSFPGEGVAELYGVTPASAPFRRVELDPASRAGLLTQPAIMAQFGTIFPEVHRGLFVREQLLCDPPAPPPPGVADLPVDDRTATDPCRSCHVSMDPIGFGFAGYDALGRFDPARAESGEVVDGGRLSTDPSAGTFESVPELADRLAESPAVERCVTIQWMRFATGREIEAEDVCGVDRIEARFRDSGGDVRELLVAIATSAGFRARHVSELE